MVSSERADNLNYQTITSVNKKLRVTSSSSSSSCNSSSSSSGDDDDDVQITQRASKTAAYPSKQ